MYEIRLHGDHHWRTVDRDEAIRILTAPYYDVDQALRLVGDGYIISASRCDIRLCDPAVEAEPSDLPLGQLSLFGPNESDPNEFGIMPSTPTPRLR